MDLNHIFLFLALVSPIAVLARDWNSRQRQRSWRIAAAAVLGITVVALVLIRQEAGYIGAGAWLALLFLPAMGLKRMTELAAHQQYKSARRLATALLWLHPSADLREQIRTLRYLEERQRVGEVSPPLKWGDVKFRGERRSLRKSRAVLILVVINLFVFAVELMLGAGGTNEGIVLLRLGALQPTLVLFGHEYWRLVAALFLHAGVIHLLFNLFALYVLGPPFEKAIGSLRFVICYLGAGLCSTAGVIMLWRFGWIEYAEVVGASGCIMGIVGAWAAFLIRDHRDPFVRRRLANIAFIVVIQIVFDLTTPQISMAAHMCGLVGGFLIGLIVTRTATTAKGSGRPEASWAGRTRAG